MFVRQLAARLPSTSAIVPTSLSPGFCYSSFRRDIPFPFSLLSKIMEVFLARSTEMGSRTLVTGALMGENGDTAARENARGAYMDSCEVMPPSAWLFTKDGAAAEQATWVSVSLQFFAPGSADKDEHRTRRCKSCKRRTHECRKWSRRTWPRSKVVYAITVRTYAHTESILMKHC
jgi:retinol dehydrogenase-12